MHTEAEQRCLGNLGAKGYAPVRIETGMTGPAGTTGYAPVRIEARDAQVRAQVERPRSLGALSNAELLDCTLAAAGRANRAVVALIAHLAEVDARGVHRLCACSSLYTYCRYELGMPEDTAQRRALAARLVRRFPLLLDRLASGELHLSGLLLLGPHLKEENLEQMLEGAKHRSEREILSLVRQFDPRPDVPARIEPLGPAPRARVMVASDAGAHAVTTDAAAGAENADGGSDVGAGSDAGSESREPRAEQRFKVQFTAGEEYVQLLQEARELLGPGENGHVVAEVHLRAMRLLVRDLKKRKCALVDKPRTGRAGASTRTRARTRKSERGAGDADCVEPRENGSVREDAGDDAENGDDPQHTVGATDDDDPHRSVATVDVGEGPRRSEPTLEDGGDPHRSVCGDAIVDRAAPEESRHLPAELRRSVWERDGGRCAFVDVRGRRCRERSGLEFHHEIAFAKGGRHRSETVSLRCRAHNALAAEQDFGTAHVARWTGRAGDTKYCRGFRSISVSVSGNGSVSGSGTESEPRPGSEPCEP
ncbi:MAG: hypothetical protein R3B13_32375 [Polyangiaceae bacterium]